MQIAWMQIAWRKSPGILHLELGNIGINLTANWTWRAIKGRRVADTVVRAEWPKVSDEGKRFQSLFGFGRRCRSFANARNGACRHGRPQRECAHEWRLHR